MKEQDYLLVSALQKMKAAMALLADARPGAVIPRHEEPWKQLIASLDQIIADLEHLVGREMEEDQPTT